MNKYKKIAMSAVAVVMAGAMMVPLAACKKNRPTVPDRDFELGWDEEPTDIAESLKPNLNDSKQLVYDENTQLVMNVGNKNNKRQGISYRTDDLTTATMPDGKTYKSGDLKPAWSALSQTLKLKFDDQYQNQDKQLQFLTPNGNVTIQNYDVITASMAEINEYGDRYLLDLNDYIYYMPNYKAFLEANPVTVFSLNGNTTTGALYAAPYFDGNNAIEKYELIRRDWVRTVLDGDMSGATGTFKTQASEKNIAGAGTTSVTSFMGTTGSWAVETTKPGKVTETLTVTVSYEDALAAAKKADSALGQALAACDVNLASLTSGNIIDLQNAAIAAKSGEVSGAQLSTILREYIKVAYKDGKNSFYDGKKYGEVTTKLSDVFNSSWGAWDVDLLAALLRCVVSSPAVFDANWKTGALSASNLYGIMARQGNMQRRVDLLALAGQLYGVRGMEARYENTYLDKDGQIQDNRANADTYTLLSNMSGFAKEGLLYTGDNGEDGRNSYNYNNKTVAAMTYDYAQTQTRFGIVEEMPAGYDFAPIVTPVSKWDEDCDASNGHEKIMRFTESWRTTKNTGFCVPKGAVENNPNKLSAVLAFIDYLFSSDGQILMTYGERSTTGNTNPDGWWYANKSSKKLADVVDSSKTIAATPYAPAQYTITDKTLRKQVFIYKGEVYEGTPYGDRNVPMMTDDNMNFFKGQEVNGAMMATDDVKVSAAGNYTNYARYIVGSTLPIGNKDQGFEAQATAACAVDGQNVVDAALNNETIKHVKNTVSQDESLWYLTVPTMLPTDASFSSDNSQKEFGATLFAKDKNSKLNIYMDLVFFGLGDTTHYICGKAELGTLKASGAAYINWLNENYKTNGLGGLTVRVSLMQTAWGLLDDLYKITSNSEA